MLKCNQKFHSEYATVLGITLHIDDYDKETKHAPYCANGHLLVATQGKYNKWHYRHKFAGDVETSPLSDWHAEWQSYFQHTEVTFTTKRGKGRRADVVEDYLVLEIQHSRIAQEEVKQRTLDYQENGKTVLWIIDGCDVDAAPAHGKEAILTFKDDWKYTPFVDVGPIYVDVLGLVYKILPEDVKSLTVTAVAFPKIMFIDAIKNRTPDLWAEQPNCVQNTLTVKQQGAGNGKTYGLIRMLASDECAKYAEFIYVTKQHSAKSIMFEEFRDQADTLGFSNIAVQKKQKKFIVSYTKKDGALCTLTLSTIDSFMYAVGNPSSDCKDLFEGILNSIISGQLEKISKSGNINYAGNRHLNAKTLFVVDETQDLSELYAQAIVVLMQYTNMDVYVVGDLLQSISNEINAFSYFKKHLLAKQELPINICRRFTHPKLVAFVNYMVPFEKYGLPEVQPYAEGVNDYDPLIRKAIPKWGQKNVDDKNYKDSNKGEINIRKCVEWIMVEYKREVDENHYGPENFLIVTPWVTPSQSELVNELQIYLQDYWVEKMTKEDYHRTTLNGWWENHEPDENYQYAVIHRSEEGTSINLEDSNYATRCVSIHSAKGDGREVVFLIDPSDFKLSAYTYKDSLKYDSLLHVAITRMKKKMFILYNNDWIGKKISLFERNKYDDDEETPFYISNYCSTRILHQRQEIFDVHQSQYSGGDTTQIVDMSHHNIRFGIMHMRAMRYFQQNDNHNQIPTVLAKIHRARITEPLDKKAFFQKLGFNNDRKIKMAPEKQIVHDNKKEIPIVTFKTKHYDRFSKILEDVLKEVKDKHVDDRFCPLECILEYYMYEAFDHGTKTRINCMEMYDILNLYSKSFVSDMYGHNKCSCKKHFSTGSITGSLSNYLTEHYDRMNALESLVDSLCEEYQTAKWNVDKKIKYYRGNKDNSFVLKSRVSFVGFTDTAVIAVYLVPNLNSLNYADYVATACIDKFILENVSYEKDQENYGGKEVKCYLLCLNEKQPRLLPDLDKMLVRQAIKKSMSSHYKERNVEVKLFFQYWMKKEEDNVSSVRNIFSAMDKDNHFPSAEYVHDCFKFIDRDYKKSKNKHEFVQSLDFLEELNAALDDSLNQFFGLEEE